MSLLLKAYFAFSPLVQAVIKPFCNPQRYKFSFPSKKFWIHFASVGEFTATASLINHLPPGQVLLTCTSQNGLKAVPPKFQTYLLPLDSASLMSKALKEINPNLLIYIESEFWPNLWRLTQAAGIPYILVNVTIKTQPLLRLKLNLKKDFFKSAERIYAQDPKSFEILSRFNKNCYLLGNLKAIQERSVDETFGNSIKKLKNTYPKVITWSSFRIEELNSLKLICELLNSYLQDTALIIAPRYLESVTQIKTFLESINLAPKIYPAEVGKITLLNKFGLVSTAVAESNLFLVGGTFCKGLAGHSPFEGVQFNTPALMGWGGYSVSKFKDLVFCVDSEEKFQKALISFIRNPTEQKKVANKMANYANQVKTNFKELLSFLNLYV